MKSLWAPWRMEFIEGGVREQRGCLFCRLYGEKESIKNLVLLKSRSAFVVMNRYPYSNGHLMVVPRRHRGDFAELTSKEHEVLGVLVARCLTVLKKALKPAGFNVGLNLGKAAGAGIVDHVHYHIVPRWVGDSNFMPVVGETRVLPEFVTDTYKKLAKYF